MIDIVKLKGIGVDMERISQIELFDLAGQEDGSINTFLYEIQKHASAKIISTSISDGVFMVEYSIPIEVVNKAEEKK